MFRLKKKKRKKVLLLSYVLSFPALSEVILLSPQYGNLNTHSSPVRCLWAFLSKLYAKLHPTGARY